MVLGVPAFSYDGGTIFDLLFLFLLYIKRVLLMSVFHFIHSVWHEYQHRSQRMTLSTKVNNWKKKKCSKNDFRFPNEAWNFWWIWNDKIWASGEVPKEHNVNLKGVCDITTHINLFKVEIGNAFSIPAGSKTCLYYSLLFW